MACRIGKHQFRRMSNFTVTTGVRRYALLVTLALSLGIPQLGADEGETDNSPDWFFPVWAAEARFNKPIRVRDTDSALGRLALKTKDLGLKDVARTHGHLCDGLVIAWVELKAALEKLFPDGIVDRTDLRAVSKNGPCWVDTVAAMTGARINFQTLRIDASIGDGFIVQRISTGEAYEVRLKPSIFPDAQAALENHIRAQRAEGKPVSAADIEKVEAMANDLSKKLLNTPPGELLQITPKRDYRFRFNDLYESRSDIINKDAPR